MGLFPDQLEALKRVDQAFADGFRAPVLVAPTGWGKTFVSAEIIRRRIAQGQAVWFLAHLDSLLDATAARLEEAQIAFSWIWGSMPTRPAHVHIVSVATAARRLNRLVPPDLVIIDECDLAVAPTYQRVLDALDRPLMLGITATPIRADGRPMTDGGFDCLIPTSDTVDLIEAGRLTRVRLFSFPPPAELLAVRRRGDDIDQVAAGDVMSRPMILGDSLEHWRRLCIEPDGRIRPTGAFCSGVAAAERLAERWREAGYRAVAISGDSSRGERRAAQDGLNGGLLDLVATADMWLAGVDISEMAAILCERRTISLRVWLQMCGRGMRKAQNWPDCLILDHVGNTRREGLGSPLVRRMHLWDLDAGRQKRALARVAAVPVCQRCYSSDVVRGVCQECSHHQEVRTPLGVTVIPGELIELDPREAIRQQVEAEKLAAQKAREKEERACKTLQELIALGQRRGYQSPEGWARMKISLRQRWRSRAPRARVVGAGL